MWITLLLVVFYCLCYIQRFIVHELANSSETDTDYSYKWDKTLKNYIKIIYIVPGGDCVAFGTISC